MGSYKDSKYYDEAFEQEKYNCHYSVSYYNAMWQEVMAIIPKGNILEIGCGTGQFAEMAIDKDHDYYGFDFSEVGIEKCQRLGDMFEVADARGDILTKRSYDIIVCFEVLEHIEEDIIVINKIKTGTVFIGSVPQGGGEAHVRSFPKMRDVAIRYDIAFDYMRKIKGRWLFKGVI